MGSRYGHIGIEARQTSNDPHESGLFWRSISASLTRPCVVPLLPFLRGGVPSDRCIPAACQTAAFQWRLVISTPSIWRAFRESIHLGTDAIPAAYLKADKVSLLAAPNRGRSCRRCRFPIRTCRLRTTLSCGVAILCSR